MQELMTIILAAGAGTRMKSSIAKVAHTVCGKPLLSYVVDAASAAGSSQIVLVLGHQAQQVREIAPKDAVCVMQEKQLGTGHAVMSAREQLESRTGTVLILCGDTPLITGQTLKKAYEHHVQERNDITVLTAVMDEPTGYGRIIRGSDGRVRAIVEHKDATDDERLVREINSGMYFFEIPALLSALNGLSNQNSQNEYYLTDTLSGILNAGGRAGTYVISDSKEIMGVNDRCQLAEAEKYINNRNITLHMKNGVTFYLPETTLIHSDITIGRDTVIYPGCVLEKGTSIGEACVIGPDTRISNSTIGNHTHIMNSVVTNAAVGDDEKLGPFAVIIAPGL